MKAGHYTREMLQKTAPVSSCRATMAAAILFAACSAASAQWVWKEGERKVFSDTPPPASVAEKNILKRPGFNAPPVAPPAAAAEAPAEGAAAAPVAAPQVPKVDRAEEQRVAKMRADSCERARKAKATMDSGVRLATTNAKGEREIMDDKARAAEARRMDDIMRSDCGTQAKVN
jgi:type IV secretory pathway VirB10-like protein